jgi:L-ascorbate metabolism protein UlaG (beta-lactamase superfamily)
MKATWLGHAAMRIETGDAVIMIDPFLTGSGVFTGDVATASAGATHVMLTHGHDDHIGDTMDICKATGATLVANFEICMYLNGKGVENINPIYFGGQVDCGAFEVALVPATHGSSTMVDGMPVYMGNPGGLVIHPKAADDPVLLHMGDTGLFSDMKLIADLHAPKVGIVPVGDRFTMGGAQAARACRDYFDFDVAIPVHYGTFPIIEPDPSKFLAAMDGAKTKLMVPEIGAAFAL